MENSSVQIKSTVTPSELLDGVKQLSITELNDFVKKVKLLHSKRQKISPTQKELDLVAKIQKRLSPDVQARLEYLRQQNTSGQITESESEELLAIVDLIDDLNLQRARALQELAAQRQMPEKEVLRFFNISQAPNV